MKVHTWRNNWTMQVADCSPAKVAWISLGFLLMVQVLSFLSLFINPEISGSALSLRSETLMLLMVSTIFYSSGAAFAVAVMRFSRKTSLFSIKCRVTPDKFSRRALLLIVIADIFLIALVWVFGSLRRDVFIGLLTFIGIPLSVIVTKVPLLYAVTRPRLSGRDLALLVAHYVFLALAYESKMGLIYVVLIAALFLKIRGLIIASASMVLGVGVMISWSVIADENLASDDLWKLLSLAAESFLHRFDSIRVALLVLQTDSISLAVRDVFDALATLMPTCSASQGCLSLTAQISERIIGIDVSVAVYEINIVSEAVILFGDLSVPIYTFIVGFFAVWFAGVYSVRFHPHQLSVPASAVCFLLLPTSLWSAGLLSTRSILFFVLELTCLALITLFMARGNQYETSPVRV